MQNLGNISNAIRSKIPVIINKENGNKEDTILLQPSSNHNYNATSNTNISDSKTNKQVDGFDDNFRLERDFSDNDLYSYHDKSSANRIDEWQAGWNVTNAIQGMFVVSLPYAVANGGYWAILAMLLASYICCYTGKILIDCLYDDSDDEIINLFDGKLTSIKIASCRRRLRIRTSYVDIAKDVWGSTLGARLVNIAQNIELLMTCILYLVLCGDLFVGSFPGSLDHSSWTMISCMMLIPCAFIRSLKFVSKLSFCNAVVHLVINAIIMFYCLTKVKSWDFSKVEIKVNIWSFPISLGIIVFSYTSQIFLPSMEGSMVDKTRFDSMLNVTHLIAAVFKASFGYLGFLTWQEETDEVITNNLPTRQLKIIVNMILVIKALLSYPLPYFASVELLESSLFIANDQEEPLEVVEKRRKKSTSSIQDKPLFMRTCYDSDGDLHVWAVCLRIGLILFTLFLAIFIPHFALLMGLIGSITGTMLSLIWPCYFHLHLKRKRLTWCQIAVDCLIIALGVLISVTGIYYSSIALYKALKNENTLKPNYYKQNNFFVNRTLLSKPLNYKNNL